LLYQAIGDKFDNSQHKHKTTRLWLAGLDSTPAGGFWPFAILKKGRPAAYSGDWENAEQVYRTNLAWLENSGHWGFLLRPRITWPRY